MTHKPSYGSLTANFDFDRTFTQQRATAVDSSRHAYAPVTGLVKTGALVGLLILSNAFTAPDASAEKKSRQLAPLESRLVGDSAAIQQQYTDIQKSRDGQNSTDKAPAVTNDARPDDPDSADDTDQDSAASVVEQNDTATAKAVAIKQVQTNDTSGPDTDNTNISQVSVGAGVTVVANSGSNQNADQIVDLAPDNIQPDMLGIMAHERNPAQATIFRDNAAILKQPNVMETVVTTTTYGIDKTETVTEVLNVDQATLESIDSGAQTLQPTPVTTAVETPVQPLSWTTVTVSKGDTLVSLFQSLGVDPTLAVRIAESDQRNSLHQLTVGQQLSLLKNPDGMFSGMRYEMPSGQRLEAHYRQDGNIVIDNIDLAPNASEERVAFGFIKSSLFEAALGVGLEPGLIKNFANIFGYEIDFSRDVRRGDRFSVIYNDNYKNGEKINSGEILAAEFINNGERHRAIRYVDETGDANFYTPDGYSLKKAFFRSPVEFTRITSSFSNRRFHPVLKKWKAHRGVDYGAAAGTPVLATAEGVISHRAAMGGYGRTVIIRHSNNYETLYAHLSDYGRSQQVGHTVHQGQVIGYVGQSGNATGPHLHYEFRVNGRHRDPLTVISDQGPGERIPDQHLADFQDTVSLLSTRLDSLNAEIAQSRSAQQPDKS